MTDEQIDRGLDAFEFGASTWSSCFFAKALKTDFRLVAYPSHAIAMMLSVDVGAVNTVVKMFDNLAPHTTKDDLRALVIEARDSRRDAKAVEALLASIPQEKFDLTPSFEVTCAV